MIDLAIVTNPGGAFAGLLNPNPHPEEIAAALIEGARGRDQSRPNLGLFFDGVRWSWTNGHALIMFGPVGKETLDLAAKLQAVKDARTKTTAPTFRGILPKTGPGWTVVELGGPLEARPMRELGGVDQVVIRFDYGDNDAQAVVTFNRDLFFYPFKATGAKPDGFKLLVHPPELLDKKGAKKGEPSKELAVIGGCYLVPPGEIADPSLFAAPLESGGWCALIMPMRP